MEEAAKRRERLMAMRSEASQRSGAAPSMPPLGAAELPDPLFSSSPAEAPTHPPRFDYYTNPSAAFSSAYILNKRKSSSFPSPGHLPDSRPHARPNVGPHNYTGPNQPPMHQLGPQFHTPPHAPPTTDWRSPQFQPQPPWNIQPPFSGPGSWQPTSGAPFRMPYTNQPRGGFTNQPRGGFTNQPRGGFTNPRFVRDTSSGPRPSHNHNPNSNSYSGSRGTGGRGPGFNSRFSQRDYYSKFMVEDPWIGLEPIAGNLIEALDLSGLGSGSGSGSRSWLPESIRKKEITKPDKTGNKYEKKLSLSEYLDLSYNQTINET